MRYLKFGTQYIKTDTDILDYDGKRVKSRMKECVNSNFNASAIFCSCAADNVGT